MYNSRTRPSPQIQVQQLTQRMRNGTGVNTLIKPQNAPTHHMDSLERFKKDYAAFDKQQRERQIAKKQQQIERKRLEYLERENNRWERAQSEYNKRKQRQHSKAYSQMMGERRGANTNGLAYNPINLSYDSNAEGEKLRRQDEDREIRRYIRARNMDDKGNSKYDLISGQDRVGIEAIIPDTLGERYQKKLADYYESVKLRVPGEQTSSSNRNRYY